MEVTFINPGVDYMIQSIMHFQAEGESEFWSEPLYHFYPQLDRTFAASLPVAERRDYIEGDLIFSSLERLQSADYICFIRGFQHRLHRLV